MDTWRDMGHTSNLNEVRTKRRKEGHLWQEPIEKEREEGERRERFHLLSKIYGVRVVVLHRAKT